MKGDKFFLATKLASIGLALGLLPAPTKADNYDPASSLPNTSPLTAFGLFGNYEVQNNVTVNGNVGVSANGTFTLMAPSTINGDVYLGSGVKVTDPGKVNGTIYYNQDLSSQQALVFSASSALAALSPSVIITGNQTGGLSYNVPSGSVEVVNLNGGLNLNNVNVTLSGGGYLVLNIKSSFSLNGTASITGTPNNIFVNFLGTSTVNTHVGDTIDGEVFLPNAAASLDGKWEGGIYSGDKMVSLLSGATVTETPEPASLALLGLGAGLGLLMWQRTRGR